MAEEQRAFIVRNLTVKEWNALEDFRREVEKYEGQSMTNKELLMWVVGRGR